ncbi:MAG: hypothetical protein ACREMA_08610, partial [Longimicrobiales bacterium]
MRFPVPTVTVTPGTGTTFTSANAFVTVDWSDQGQEEGTLDPGTSQILLNGVDVTSQFNYSGTSGSATSTGTVTLQPGSNSLYAAICNIDGCGSRTVNYSYDNGGPSVSIDPPNGSFTSPNKLVTITWSHPFGVNPASREIKLNGVNVTSDFDFNSNFGNTLATSADTVELQPGNNILTARICDVFSNCSPPDTAIYNFSNDNVAPTATINPGSGNFGSANLAVTVSWSDNIALNGASRVIQFNGSTVTFDYHGSATAATSSGTVTLLPGIANTLTAQICDIAGNCSSTATAFYTLDQGPTVNINPSGGTFGNAILTITIEWSDQAQEEGGLVPGSREITLNQQNVTGLFNYTGTSGSATSTGSVTLQSGSNSFSARICDANNSCTTQPATYIYDNVPPVASINPDGGSFSTDNLSITITWSDNVGLNASSRIITLNANPANGSFGYDIVNSTTATSSGVVGLQIGSNTLTARICDSMGNCSVTDTAVYIRSSDTVLPTAAINPSGGTFSTASRPVTITWADNSALDTSPAAREIMFNGAPATGFNFNPTNPPTSATSDGVVMLQNGTNTFTARIRDAAGNWSTIQTATYILSTGGSPAAPLIDVASVNPGNNFDRSLCLSINLGDAAVECGDLRVVHALPATLHLNKQRQPTLIYNSQTGHPYPHVQANVTLPASGAVPDTVEAILSVNSVTRATRKWPGNQWTPGAARRIAIGYDAINDSTGVYSYTLEVKNQYNGSFPQSATASGELTIVNRANSYFGAGWWLSGLERLIPASMTWIGGDASIRKYTLVTSNVWAAAHVDQPDTIKFVSGSYIRYLKGGTQVYFNTSGQHFRTQPRLGVTHRTEFTYSSGRLTAITMTAPVSPNAVYSFAYPTSPWPKVMITAPPLGLQGRVTEIWLTTGPPNPGIVSLIIDPDGRTHGPGYWGKRVNQYTNRRGVTTVFDYDFTAFKVQASHLNMGAGVIIADTIRSIETQVAQQAM